MRAPNCALRAARAHPEARFPAGALILGLQLQGQLGTVAGRLRCLPGDLEEERWTLHPHASPKLPHALHAARAHPEARFPAGALILGLQLQGQLGTVAGRLRCLPGDLEEERWTLHPHASPKLRATRSQGAP